jgi:hypothetical protein
MPTQDDLAGLGMPTPLATVLGNQPSNLTCTGTSQTTAATMLTRNLILNAQTSQTGAILQNNSKVGSPWWVANGTLSTTSAVVYAPVGNTLNGVLNNSVTIAQNGFVIIFQSALKTWYTK